ncbi:hypothetical protein [Nocardioides marmoribigeumensis]|uniref:Uncharacterized protein n=1 Tax=Nocardioides marmoribigeumensis TaxID=433649 RepID=A0ABU2BT42_9ACTN|nr:hypothetical protein [Nocardioides marmoribigeumensis]MDR7361446.1 hypothetical protein [Nocardioides marmoribigeumensis]
MRKRLLLRLVLALGLSASVVSPAVGSPQEGYTRPHVGNGNVPAGCIVDRDPINPDNHCYHMKVGLNALDSPKVDVDVLIPVSPAAERDLRVATQAVQMWDDGLHYLARQMRLAWLARGFDMNVRTHDVVMNPDGSLQDPLKLVDPEIVVVVSNPAGGIGIGIDPSYFAGELGIVDDSGVPCAPVENPFSMKAWKAKPGFEQHGGEPGGIYVEDCGGGVGGNVCFAVNGAVDPVTGASDFFPLFDLVSHEFGHCLTLGHVGDGADGPWGPTPTNDIMAYSTDPPLINKCVSSLDVEGFALRMSKYLDVNGDRTVDRDDLIRPNDVKGDGANSFQVQHPADHTYASSTGDPGDCPQPDLSLTPLAEGDFMPEPRATTRPQLRLRAVSAARGRLRVAGTAVRVPLAEQPTARSASLADASGDAHSPVTDLQGLRVKVTRTAVEATMKVGQVWPVTQGTSLVAYSLTIDGRRLDSFIPTGSSDGKVMVLDNGTGYPLPAGTARWDTTANTVTFKVRRDYLADQQVRAPYNVYAVTGYHTRTNDWVANDDLAPDKVDLDLAAPAMGPETRDAPVASRVRTVTSKAGSGSFTPADSTLGVGLVSAVDSRDYVRVPVEEQSSALVTLRWNGDASMGLTVGGGSSQKPVATKEANTLKVLVPWARRDLTVTVDPQEVLDPTDYTLTVTRTTVVADRDRDHVPDVADGCPRAKGPSAGAGCPDTDRDSVFDKDDACPRVAGIGASGCPTRRGEKVVALVDGRRVAARSVMTRHGGYGFVLRSAVARGRHRLVVRWVDDGRVVARVSRSIG